MEVCAFGLGGCGKGSFLGGFGIHEAILNVGAAAGIAAVADLRGRLLIFLYAKALTARGALRLIEGGLTLVALLLLTGLDFLLAGVDVLLGLAFGAETFGLQTLCLQLLFTGAASGLTDLVLLVELLLVDLGQRVVTDDAEHTVCDPVDTHCGRHDEADPDGHEGHDNVHALHGSCWPDLRRRLRRGWG